MRFMHKNTNPEANRNTADWGGRRESTGAVRLDGARLWACYKKGPSRKGGVTAIGDMKLPNQNNARLQFIRRPTDAVRNVAEGALEHEKLLLRESALAAVPIYLVEFMIKPRGRFTEIIHSDVRPRYGY